jgi:hypothetical protein
MYPTQWTPIRHIWSLMVLLQSRNAVDKLYFSWWDFRFSRRWVWRRLSSGMLRRVVSLKFMDVSEVLAASIIRAMSGGTKYIWNVGKLLPLFALMKEEASASEASVNFYQTTQRNIPEDSRLHLYFSSLSRHTHIHLKRNYNLKLGNVYHWRKREQKYKNGE